MTKRIAPKLSNESGQALTELMGFLIFLVLVVSAMRVFASIANADDSQIAEARWMSFHCAYRHIYCNALVEPHTPQEALFKALSSERTNELGLISEPSDRLLQPQHGHSSIVERQFIRVPFNAGTSLLARNAAASGAVRSIDDFASHFGVHTRDELHMARVTSSVQINESGSKFGLPNQISLPPRRLAMLVGDGSVEATTQGEMHTVERVKQSIALPGQHALDGLLAINDSLKGLLRTLGLETVETTWSKREVKLLEREAFNKVQNDE
ncbi:MAG: hypothetical protein ACK5DS_06780 [Burkholderiales bacterium]|jgi:hypothetical protein